MTVDAPQLPPGGVQSRVTVDDGWPLRTMDWRGGTAGSLLFLSGRADFIEKYAEGYSAFREWGFALSAFDWRGQGGSGRLVRDPQRGHSSDFGRWVDDLDRMVARFVTEMPGPHVAVAHSMGGHLLLRHLARGKSPLTRAALLAPMLGVRAAPPPLRWLATLMSRFGLGEHFAVAQRPYGPWQERPERQDLLTGSPERFAQEHNWLTAHPEWSLGGVTWGWIAAAQRSLDILAAPGVLEAIATPTLTLVGERERLVDARLAARLGNGLYEIIPNGRHELLRDTDEPRLATLSKLKAFLLP